MDSSAPTFSMGGNQRSKPSFFKVLINEGFPGRLQLPVAFARDHGGMLAEVAVLTEASSGDSWEVKVDHINGEKWFTLGWDKFAEDLELKMGEFLVFWLARKSAFDVSVLGISGCERRISRRKSDFGSSAREKQMVIFRNEHICSGRDVSKNKRGKDKVLAEAAAASCTPSAVDLSRPLYFEIVLKDHHRTKVPLSMDFGRASGLVRRTSVNVKYVPNRNRLFAAEVRVRPRSRFDLGWAGFVKENGLVIGRTYSFEFDPEEEVIRVDEIKK